MSNVPNFLGTWSISTTYAQYDLATYQGTTYISNVSSNTGHTPGQTSQWSVFAQAGENGINTWRGTWDSTVDYNAFDAVSYNSASYISLTNINQDNIPSSSPSQWAVLASAGGTGPAGSFIFVGVWSSVTTYAIDNIVSYNGSSYAATGTPITGTPPTTDTSHWQLIASVGAAGATGPAGAQGTTGLGFNYRGVWASGTSYVLNDVVTLLGSSWVAVASNVGVNPTIDTGSNWKLFAAGNSSILPPSTTSGRTLPNTVPAGTQYYDTTLHFPLWSDGIVWRDASGVSH